MAGEWTEAPLGDFITLQRGFDLPKQNRQPGKIPIISSSGVSDFHSEIGVKGPGVVTGRYGTIGQVFFIREDYWPLNTALWVNDFKGNDPLFTSYLLRTIDFQSCSDKSSVPGVNRNDLHQIEVRFPSLAIQHAIAHILGSLDDMIELNRRMNETLEGIARAFFQSWFVDFDPVRAKLDGRSPYGMDQATADLFPDSFEDSSLGPIPKSWRVGILGDVAVNKREVIQPAAVDIETPYIGLEHMPRRSIALSDWGTAGRVVSGKSVFMKGDILFGKLRPYFHKVGVAAVDGVCSTDIMVLTPKSSDWFGFTLGHCSSDSLIASADGASTGTRMPRTNWDHIRRFEVTIPPDNVAKTFSNFVKGLVDQIVNSVHRSHTLADLRDTLLPKLLSGELSVDEAGRCVEQAV